MRFRHVLGMALIAALVLLPLPLAQAHAELVSSNPASGAQLDTLPSKISVTFDANLLRIGGATTNVIILKDPQGKQIDAKNSQVTGATLSVDTKPVTLQGKYTVSWRVVSGDGHPEEGTYGFTVGSAVISPTQTLSPSQTETPASPQPSGPSFWSVYGTRLMLVVVGAFAIGIWAYFERARRKLR